MTIILGRKNKITGKVEETIKQEKLKMLVCPFCGKDVDGIEMRTFGEKTKLIGCGNCLMVFGAFPIEKKKSIF